ncbi:MAG: RNA polymerase sigma factor [Planctomycetes bacterium]|nr:RNA polymerase sigma factor [Planctomycetota bacterium]
MSDVHDTIVRSACHGDEVAIDVLLERHLPGLEAYVRLHSGRILQHRESNDDIVQSVCREVLEDMQRFDYSGEAAFRSWLFRVAESKIIDRLRYWQRDRRDHRRDRRQTGVIDRDYEDRFARVRASLPSPSQHVIAREDLQRLESAFERLSPEHREVILMARIIGHSHKEIAVRLQRSETATRMLLRRALVHLGRLMDDDD